MVRTTIRIGRRGRKLTGRKMGEDQFVSCVVMISVSLL